MNWGFGIYGLIVSAPRKRQGHSRSEGTEPKFKSQHSSNIPDSGVPTLSYSMSFYGTVTLYDSF